MAEFSSSPVFSRSFSRRPQRGPVSQRFVGPSASICCWTGYNDGGTFVTRDYANIYHACSSYTSHGGTEIEYHNANGTPTDGDEDSPGQALCVNPGDLGSSGGNQRSVWCGAYNGGTTNVTNVTCQTSRP